MAVWSVWAGGDLVGEIHGAVPDQLFDHVDLGGGGPIDQLVGQHPQARALVVALVHNGPDADDEGTSDGMMIYTSANTDIRVEPGRLVRVTGAAAST